MEYKLTYFPSQGLAESTRFMLKYGGIEFEDEHVQQELWPQVKTKYSFGQLPILTVNGREYNQSIAIARFVAKKVKLVGVDEFEDFEIDAIVDTIGDLRLKLAMYYFEQDQKVKESMNKTLLNETIPYYMDRFEQIAIDNADHFACKRLTWADFFFVSLLDTLNFFSGIDILAKYPHLQAMQKNVLAIPAIKAWVEVRPKRDL